MCHKACKGKCICYMHANGHAYKMGGNRFECKAAKKKRKREKKKKKDMERKERNRRKKERGKEKKGRKNEGENEVGVPTVETCWTKE